MSIFQRGEALPTGRHETAARRYKIRITTCDGDVLYWHKRGRLHVVDEDVARIFVENFKPELFGVEPDGSMLPPAPGRTKAIQSVAMEPA